MPSALLEAEPDWVAVMAVIESNSFSEGEAYRIGSGAIQVMPSMAGVTEKRGWGEVAEGTARFVFEWGGGEALSFVAGVLWNKAKLLRKPRLNRRAVNSEQDVLAVLQEARDGDIVTGGR